MRYFIIIFPVLAGMLPATGLACSCRDASLEVLYGFAAQVFVARIILLEETEREVRIEAGFEIVEVFKGDPSTLLRINTAARGTSCGVHLGITEHFLLFVSDTGSVSSCGGSMAASDAYQRGVIDELKVLRTKASN